MLERLPRDRETALAEFRRVDLLREENVNEVHRLMDELIELEGEFIAGELNVRSGKRKGQPLTKGGRRRRVERLVWVARYLGTAHRDLNQLDWRADKLWEAT